MPGRFAHRPSGTRPTGRPAARYDPEMLALGLLMLASVAADGDGLRLEFDAGMRSRVVDTQGGGAALGPFTESETLLTASGELRNFRLESREEARCQRRAGRRPRAPADRPRRRGAEARRDRELSGMAALAVRAGPLYQRRQDRRCRCWATPVTATRSRRRREPVSPRSGRTSRHPTRAVPTGCCRSSPATRAATSSA